MSGVDDLDTCTGRQSCSGGKCADVSASEDLAVATLGSYFGQFGSSKQQLAQTLTVDAAGQLIEVRLAVALDWQDSFTVGIYAVASDGTPSPTQLASVPTAVGTTPVLPSHGSGVQYRSLALVTALQVSAGERIAIVVDAPNNTQNCLWYGSRDDVYAGGSAYVLAQGQATWSDQRNDLAVASLILR